MKEYIYGERKEKHQISPETSIWSKGMSPFGVLDDGETSTNEGETPTTSKTETVDTPTNTPTNTPTDLISRQAVKYHTQLEARGNGQYEEVEVAYKSDIESLPPVEDMGEVSDGYHTFNQLYHQRAVLFATIVNQNKDNAWKSWKHEDGKFCFDKEGEWFIVGVDTPEGSYTYHYEKKYWDLFDCKELDRGKHWDGHTEDDVTRLLSLPPVEPKPDLVNRSDVLELAKSGVLISNDNYKKVCEAINGLPSCHTCRECEPVEPKPVMTKEVREAIMRLTMCAREDCSISKYENMDTILKAFTERPKGECRTCKRCSDHCCETDDDFTRCPIEEHYMLPKDGYCHLYDPIWR